MSSNNTHSDEIQLRAIRRALANRNAAVMVGSGFSRNAEGGQNVGTWEDLAEALARGLNAPAEKVSFNAANATQLAEQYERLFSRPALEQVLRQVVPDERLAPGRLHVDLMSLPWSEVLTTNYDTLLERTAETLLESSYFTICCREDIPQSKILGRRRIVKLHGSFASHRPFVVTEEDYRKYPSDSAPFVNLVRQSLLENVLCLVGFSGDDPNFLHWIGWVRDMQDQHALPIYLLLSKEATAGQRALLQARGVTPVLLPPSASGEDSDYEGRYRRLFEMLNEPLEGSVSNWGEIEWDEARRQYKESADDRYSQFVEALPFIAAQRANYPGWLVAPQRIRRRFAVHVRGSGHWFSEAAILKKLEAEPPAVALAAFGLYVWVQSVLLEDLDDAVAQVALRILNTTADLKFSQIKDLEKRLKPFGFKNQNALSEGWTKLSLAVLLWSRQGHHAAEYAEVQRLLSQWRSKDPNVKDHLAYQAVLLHLHEGDRSEALRVLGRWRIQGSDVYMQIRRAVLVAELGRVTEALSSCEKAVQLLRQHQRLEPNDPYLLSMESWACLITMQIHESVEQLSRYGMSVDSEEDTDASDDFRTRTGAATADSGLGNISAPNDSQNATAASVVGGDEKRRSAKLRSDEFNERLAALGKKGYASEDELRRIVDMLNEDASDPTAKNSPYSSFELQIRPQSRTIGLSAEHRNKVTAAQTWLQLTERVGLTPMVGKTRFYTEEFLQAAWWIRDVERDPLRRGLGIMFRCVRADVLKPRDRTRPAHKTGWLSRLQVASLDLSFAEIHAERFLNRLESLLASPRLFADVSKEFEFSASIFSRIVLRVASQPKVFGWAIRLLELHTTRGLLNAPDGWHPVGQALVQCMEALSFPFQQRILFRLFQLPLQPPAGDIRRRDTWLNVQPMLSAMRFVDSDEANNRDYESLDWSPMVEELLRAASGNLADDSKYAWLRLFALDILKKTNPQQRQAVGALLWRGHDGKKLPTLSGFFPHATLRWPAPKGIDLDSVYKNFWLQQEFKPFSSGGYMSLSVPNGRTYQLPVNDRLLQGVKASMERAPWSSTDFFELFSRIEKWLDAYIDSLSEDMRSHSEVKSGVIRLLLVLDEVLSLVLVAQREHQDDNANKVLIRIWAMYDRLQVFRIPLWRLSLLKAVSDPDPLQLVARVGELELAMVSRDLSETTSAHAVANWALRASIQGELPPLGALFERLVSTVSGRVMPSLSIALDVLAIQPPRVWKQYLTLSRLFLLNGALTVLQDELKVDGYGRCDDVDEEAVPLLRFRCAELAFAINLHSGYACPAALDWVEQASQDALPELRLRAFADRVVKSE